MPDSKTGEPELEAIRARVEAATPGEWFTESDGIYIYNASRSYLVTPTGDSDQDRADADFIAHARSDVPALLELVAALSTENERLRGERDGFRGVTARLLAGWHPRHLDGGRMAWAKSQVWERVTDAEKAALADLLTPAALTSPDPEGEA